jgi:fructose-1,6-bisphosphatase II
MTKSSPLQYLALEFVRATEQAAVAAARWIGRGDKNAADQAAVDAMRQVLNEIHFQGEIVIGEGEKDKAPQLYIGERVGKGDGPLFDIAVDPLECTSSVAFGRPNAITVVAVGPQGMLYKAVDSYMEKIAVGPEAKSVVDLDASPKENIKKVAEALGKDVSEITVAIIDRERHKQLIEDVRRAGARVQLFTDGDIAFGIAPSLVESPVDILMGIGGSTEAVLAAAALKCLGGQIFARWKPKDETHQERLRAAGITDLKKIYTRDDLARGDDLAFIATGVVGGPLLDGVVMRRDHILTHSVSMTLSPRSVRFLKTKHLA